MRSGRSAAGILLVTADIQRGRKSVAGGRVGFADFYVRREGGSMVKAMLDIRTGMGRYIIDPAGAYGSGSVKLMPTYDPRDEARYLDFIRAYREWTPRGRLYRR